METLKKRAWLIAFGLLLGVAALLMARADRPKGPARRLAVEFPRRATPEENFRRDRRRTLAPAPLPEDEEGVRLKRDPLLVALPTDRDKSALVFEVEDLKASPIGQIWMDCMLARQGERRGRDRIEERLGINLFEDVERVAVSSGKVVILGVTPGAAMPAPSGATPQPHGERGQIYEMEEDGPVFATWGDEIIVTGQSRAEIEAALDRLEGKGQAPDPVIPDWATYGDIYGVLSPEDLADMLPEEQSELAARLREAVHRVELHVDASEDVALVADVTGPDAAEMSDLAKSLGAALTVARAGADGEGDERLSGLLEHATVHPRDGRFSVDLALPLELLKEAGPCRKREGEGRGARDR